MNKELRKQIKEKLSPYVVNEYIVDSLYQLVVESQINELRNFDKYLKKVKLDSVSDAERVSYYGKTRIKQLQSQLSSIGGKHE